MDDTTTISDLKQRIKCFCEERDWNQFHNPKDLAIGISTEANELLDIFRFKTEEQMKEIFLKEHSREHVEEEIADVLFFVIRFAQMNHLDLDMCLKNKMEKNSRKYSVEKSKGNNLKYSEMME
ncbi:MAG: nucleotide pyrophosphohydrolase [Lachnospiraceae bacterium]|nr:nucleotide pyrophosphohydrolase [Lachnospiraceae bacterium]